ncbi:hypothetical protein Q5Y75_02780 [Ruegeria sp. 2205SS24-7]|uniref:hypothetical protein n=1 Tax=Ruegeria discodermiae TaxID=3064389 RepID=UPI0027422B34|nr:hypothetical protein [Ruegeria sp. 2205SS24-7]MDP5216131.1 hypothetical protein [Ruegeria sp. 2205SS24-7]
MKKLWVLAFSVLSACQVATGAQYSGGSGAGVAVSTNTGAAFSTPYGTRVYQVDANIFEVVPYPLAGRDEYWCGASDYARRRLGAAWSQQIYMASKTVRSAAAGGRTAVQFTLNPQAIGLEPVDVNVRTGLIIGDHMTVQRANGFCQPFPPLFF